MDYELIVKKAKLPGSDGEHIMQKEFNTEKKALKFYNKQVLDELSPLMCKFIEEQEMVFVSTADSNGECDCTFRSGEAGFIRSINKHTIIYPEYKGNGVMASIGNISENNNIAFLFIDFFETKIGLHVNGKAKIVKNEDVGSYLDDMGHSFEGMGALNKIACHVVVEVEEAYIHCSKNIPHLKKLDTSAYRPSVSSPFSGGDAFNVKSYDRAWTK